MIKEIVNFLVAGILVGIPFGVGFWCGRDSKK